jgi:hypothetical protein
VSHYIVRNILIIFGIPMVAYAILQGFNWYENMTESHDLAPIPEVRVQFPLHNPWGIGGVNRYEALSDLERADLDELLGQSITQLDPWLDRVSGAEHGLVCLGENHDGHLRRLIATQILPRLPADILMIEANRTGAARMVRHSGNRDYVPLLNRDISAVILAAKNVNAGVRVLGIEETRRQYDDRRSHKGIAREKAIDQNLRAVYVPGQRHVVLYGAFHCSHQSKLYKHLLDDPLPGGSTTMLNIRVAREHIEAPIETFVFFLDEIGFLKGDLAGDIVITDTAALAKRFRQWFPFFATNELEHYSALVIMRPLRYAPTD